MSVVHCIGRLLTVTVIWKTCDSEYDYCTGFEMQRAKKVVSNSPGLVNFAIGLVMFVLITCLMGKCCFGGNSN